MTGRPRGGLDTPRKAAKRGAYYARRDHYLAKAKEYAKARYSSDPAVRERAKAYYQANKDRIIATTKARHRRKMGEDPHYRAGYLAKVAKLKESYNGRPVARITLERRRAFRRTQAHALRDEFLMEYGGKCACCGERDIAFLTLDHVNRDGAKHRKGLGLGAGRSSTLEVYRDIKRRGWPKDSYRILCMNCNWATRSGAPCPHADRRMAILGADATPSLGHAM